MTDTELDAMAAGARSCLDPYGTTAADDVLALVAEVRRLRRGDFTPEEFQALCHHRDEQPGCTRADFEGGCRGYQDKLFGPSGTPDAATAERERLCGILREVITACEDDMATGHVPSSYCPEVRHRECQFLLSVFRATRPNPSSLTEPSMNRAFAYHQPGPRAVEEMQILRAQFDALHDMIDALPGGPSREKALALTHLEEMAMWANKHCVHADPRSVPEPI